MIKAKNKNKFEDEDEDERCYKKCKIFENQSKNYNEFIKLCYSYMRILCLFFMLHIIND